MCRLLLLLVILCSVPLLVAQTHTGDMLDLNQTITGQKTFTKPLILTEVAAPSGIVLNTLVWPDSTAHRPKFNPNSTGALFFVGASAAGTAGHCPQYAANGIDLVDSGSATCGGGGGGTVTGSGTTNFIPIWTSSTGLGDSDIQLSSGLYFTAKPWNFSNLPTTSTAITSKQLLLQLEPIFTGSPTTGTLQGAEFDTQDLTTSSTPTVSNILGVGITAYGSQSGSGETAAMSSVTGLSVASKPPTVAATTNVKTLLVTSIGAAGGPPATVTNRYGIQVNSLLNRGTVTNDYGLRIESPSITDTGTLTNRYGLYIDDQTLVGSGGNTNPHGIYVAGGGIQTKAVVFSAIPACAAGLEGRMEAVTDSTTNTWGATVTGGGANHVLAYCDGTVWSVMAK